MKNTNSFLVLIKILLLISNSIDNNNSKVIIDNNKFTFFSI